MILDADGVLERTGLAGQAHSVDEEWLSGVLWQAYGLRGRLARLATEKDATFKLTATTGPTESQFLVKVSQPE